MAPLVVLCAAKAIAMTLTATAKWDSVITILGVVAPLAHVLFVVVGIDLSIESAIRVVGEKSRSHAGIALAARLVREEARAHHNCRLMLSSVES